MLPLLDQDTPNTGRLCPIKVCSNLPDLSQILTVLSSLAEAINLPS